jgi:CRP-like cAMP-binding protein
MNDQSKRLFKAGSYIYIEGDEDVDEVYIVEKGLVEFKSTNQRVRTHGENAAPGDVFGFISSLSQRPRMETAFAKVNSTVIAFNRERFLVLLKKNSEIAIKLLNSYADELRLYDTMIFPLGGVKGVFLPEDVQLFNLGEYYAGIKMNSNAYYVLSRYLQLFPDGSDRSGVRKLLTEIEKTGIRRIPEPIPDGIYRQYADKQIIFCEHEPGNELFIIKSGRVKIVKYHGDSEIILSVLREGEIFGELAIVSDKPRNATAVSFGTTVLLPIDKGSMLKLIQKSSDLLKRIFTAISQRVWFTFIRTESKFYQKPITRVYVFLENKLIEDNISLKSREPHIFNFGIDELLKMNSIPTDKVAVAMSELSRDQNLNFYMGQTVIDNPSLVSSKARYYRSRDHLYEGSEATNVMQSHEDESEIVEFEEDVEVAEDLADMRVPRPDVEEMVPGSAGTLFEELDKEIGKRGR